MQPIASRVAFVVRTGESVHLAVEFDESGAAFWVNGRAVGVADAALVDVGQGRSESARLLRDRRGGSESVAGYYQREC